VVEYFLEVLHMLVFDFNEPKTLDVPASAAYPAWIIVDVISPEEVKVDDV